MPMFQAMTPAPRVHVLRMGAGVHTYTKPEPGLPVGIAPAAAQFYHDAITGGFFVVCEAPCRPLPQGRKVIDSRCDTGNRQSLRRSCDASKIEWPEGKKICATLTVAFEAFTRGGHFKKAQGQGGQPGLAQPRQLRRQCRHLAHPRSARAQQGARHRRRQRARGAEMAGRGEGAA